MGSIFKRGDTYWIQYYRDGLRERESTYSSKYDDAKDLLRRREGEVEKGLPGGDRKKTMADAHQLLLDDYVLKGNTTGDEVARRWRLHLSKPFGAKRLTAITAATLTAYAKARMEAGAANDTIRLELADLRRAFRLARRAGWVAVVPDVPTIRPADPRKGFFEAAEFRRLITHLPAEVRPPVTFGYLTGWRMASEVLTLRWDHIDLKAGEIILPMGTTKNRRGRELHLPPDDPVLALLKAQRQATPVGVPWVFHREGRPIRTFRKTWDKACEKAGLRGRLVHDLRRTAARNFIRAGVPETVAMSITGHVTRSVFDRYNITSGRDQQEAFRRLARAADEG